MKRTGYWWHALQTGIEDVIEEVHRLEGLSGSGPY